MFAATRVPMPAPDSAPRSRANQVFRQSVKRVAVALGPCGIALAMLILRLTCRVRLHSDPRPELRAKGVSYVFSVLHAHQIAAATGRERGTAAMVSQSRDGDYVAMGLRLAGVKTIRGSNRSQEESKGGLAAIRELITHVRGGQPALLAVDGPRGPRNHVHKGIAAISKQADAVVLNVVAVPTRRWIFQRSWDRFQIPKPFSRIDIFVAEPIWPNSEETIDAYSRRIEQSLCELESQNDREESQIATSRARRR
jgi:lysophospholipid acyltransferase (LPLAT)-like uncharacterized protein